MASSAISIRVASAGSPHEQVALAQAPFGVWGWDKSSRELTLSPSCLALAKTDDTHPDLARLIHADDLVRLDAAFNTFAASDAQRFTFRFRAGTEPHVDHFEAVGIAERDDDGALRRLSGWVIETAQTPGFLETVLEAVPNPVFVKDENERRWIGCNRAFAALIGRTVAETLGHRDADFFEPEQADHFVRMDDEVFEIGGNVIEEPITIVDGKPRWLLTHKKLAVLPTGERILVGVITDITERRHAEQALAAAHEVTVEASRTKSRFLANLSDEIRTPISGVVSMVESIDTGSLSQDQREALEIIRSSGDALLSVINDILDYSNLDGDAVVVESIDFSPRNVAEDVTRVLAEAARHRPIDFVVDVHRDVPSIVQGDPTRTRQILFNLVGNALKFTKEGVVLVSVQRAPNGDAIDFCVVDSGAGIPRDRLTAVFGDDDRGLGQKGLGLSISLHLAGLMKGQLLVESEEGVGSIFTFRLPWTGVDGAPAPERIVARAALIDIPTTIAMAIARCLVAAGTEVRAVSKASEVPKDFDVVIVDGQHGAERAIDTLSRRRMPIPILALRRDEDEPYAGVSLAQPIVANELRRALRAVLGQTSSPEPSPPMTTLKPLGIRVLVAEDNRVNQLVARRLLARVGVEVDVVDNGRDAVAAAAKQKYDAILMDCDMPIQDGFEATIAIRAMAGHYDKAPIIALTGSALGSERERCLAAGMSDHVRKPVRLEELHRVLSSWCPPK